MLILCNVELCTVLRQAQVSVPFGLCVKAAPKVYYHSLNRGGKYDENTT